MSDNAGHTRLLDSVEALIKSDLAPLTERIDQEGLYPEEFLHKLGELGGFGTAVPVEFGGTMLGLAAQSDVVAAVARQCGATAFLVWCQAACASYLLHSANPSVRARYLRAVAGGDILAGTGMSNAIKHLAGIERIHLKAEQDDDAYLLTGALPWVSNISPDHLIMVAASVQGGGYVMAVVRGDAPGVSLHPCPRFSALEGTRTRNVRFKNVQVNAHDVLAHPDQFEQYIQRIKPGFVLSQTGMGLGITQASIDTIDQSNLANRHVNQFLDDQGSALQDRLAQLLKQAHALAKHADTETARIIDVLELRAATSELALRAANSAVLHAGAKGYLMRHPAQRRLREAVFVAIVTPALKHLRKEIADLRSAASSTEPALSESRVA